MNDLSVSSLSPLEAARQLAPLIRASAGETEANRQLPRPLFEALADAGMFHLAIPRAIGGAEIDLPTYVRVIEQLAQADASTAWAVNQGAIFGTYAARMQPHAAREIWMDVPRSVVSNSPAPTAKAIPVPGGYRVTANQGFSTGCRHASWVAAHAQVYDNGVARLNNGKVQGLYCFVPVAQAEIVDTWHTRGMRGTGTNNFVVNEVFVPEHLTVFSANPPPLNEGPLYKIPRTMCFACGDAMVALGTARSCISEFFELAGAKVPRNVPRLLREQSLVQFTVGQAEAAVRSGRALLMEAVTDVWAEATSNDKVTLERRVALRLATTHAIRLAAQAIERIYDAAGATAAYESHVIQRHFQDIHVITQHVQGHVAHYEFVGKHWLGLEVDESRI